MESVNKLRLITFSCFDCSQATFSAESFQRFVSQAVSFENHYLQSPDWTQTLQRRVGCGPIELPPDAEIPAARDSFQWLHVEVDNEVEAAHILNQFIDVQPANDSLTVVTFCRGVTTEVGQPFSSILPESLIRVPLWVSYPAGVVGATQALTGTEDLVAMVERFAGEGGLDSTAGNVFDLSSPFDEIPDRRMVIRSENTEALRSESFLFVRAKEVDEVSGEFVTALYSKPDDLWNLLDVSGEYPDVVRQLEAELDAAG